MYFLYSAVELKEKLQFVNLIPKLAIVRALALLLSIGNLLVTIVTKLKVIHSIF